MKILIISQYFKPENFRINDLAEQLIEKKHKVTVLTGLPNYPKGKLFKGYNFFSFGRYYENRLSIIRVPIIPRFSSKGWQLFLNYFSFALSASLISPFISKKYDLIFVYEPSPFTVGIPAVLIKKFIKKPIIFWVQDLWPESLEAAGKIKSPVVIYLISKMVRWIYKNCDVVLVQSKGFINSVINSGAMKEKIIYIPNWAENEYILTPKNTNFDNLDFPKNGFKVLFAGNLGAAQSLNTIIKAAVTLKNSEINWIIVGDGRYKKYLMENINDNSLQDKFFFIDQQPLSNMSNLFSSSDVLLVTLLKKHIFSLTVPGKIQSYMASGKPIVAAIDGEGFNIINNSKSGIAVKAEDHESLANAILNMSKMNKSDLDNMGKMGFKYYQDNFNRESLIQKIEKIMMELKKL